MKHTYLKKVPVKIFSFVGTIQFNKQRRITSVKGGESGDEAYHDIIGGSLRDFFHLFSRPADDRAINMALKAGSVTHLHWEASSLENGINDALVVQYSPVYDGSRNIVGGMVYIVKEPTSIEQVNAQPTINTSNLKNLYEVKNIAATTAPNKDFVAMAAHDLKAPIRVLNSYSKALKKETAGQLNDQANFYLNRIDQVASNMDQLLKDLMRLSVLHSSQLQKQEIDMTSMCQSIVTQLSEADEVERAVEVTIEPGVDITEGDFGLVKMLFGNLIANAWKYTSKREKAEIVIGRITLGNEIIYYVRDNGAGFDDSLANELFQPFRRLHEAADYQGNGMGLAIAKRIVDLHKGRIWAKSSPDQGAVFYIHLGEKIAADLVENLPLALTQTAH